MQKCFISPWKGKPCLQEIINHAREILRIVLAIPYNDLPRDAPAVVVDLHAPSMTTLLATFTIDAVTWTKFVTTDWTTVTLKSARNCDFLYVSWYPYISKKGNYGP